MLTDTIVLDLCKIAGKNDRGYRISDMEITPKDDSRWIPLDYYAGGVALCIKIPCPNDRYSSRGAVL
jgi:hypothetical protein